MTTVDTLIQDRPGFAAMKPASQDKAIEIYPDIWMSSGTSNAYLIKTKKGRIMVNTGMGFEALTHKKLFDQVCPGPTLFIILTQGHVDHVGGVKTFCEPGTVVIAQQNNPACQRDDERIQTIRSSQAYIWFQATIDKAIEVAQENPEALIQDKPIPNTLFRDNYHFSVDGEDYQLLATPGGETVDSCVLWLPNKKILFSGNVFGPLFPHFPNINTIRGDKYRFIEPYLQSLQRIRELEPETLITGHFEPITGAAIIKESLDRLEQAVTYVHSETLRGMNAGKDIYTLMKEIQLPKKMRVGEGYGKISWAVRTIWESYMGWFKAQHTSELYSVESHAVYSELVSLAGVEAVASKGEQLLAGGDIEKALLLSEAAIKKEPENTKALKLSLQCHEALLKRSQQQNFWESGWLQSQIQTLKKQISKG